MPGITFEDNHFSRKTLQLLLVIEVVALVIVIGSIIFRNYSAALAISFLTFVILIFTSLLLYVRYRNNPVVREKNDLQQKVIGLRNNVQRAKDSMQAAKQRRDSLVQNEQNELDTSLRNLQTTFIQQGLKSTYVKDATIPGIGSKLKERLITNHVVTAEDIGNNIFQIPGFGETKQQALIDWRNMIFAKFDETKPIKLPDEQIREVRQKYQVLHDENNLAEQKAQTNKQDIENVLTQLESRLQQLAAVTFPTYVSNSLASRKIIAAFLFFSLAITQLISSVSAATSSIIAAIPTATTTFTATLTPTQTFTPTVTFTSTITETSTITHTPTITFTPTITYTPTNTRTLTPTLTAIPTIDPLQNVTAICQDGTYSYSAHQQGTCSGHGGVKQWINKPPN